METWTVWFALVVGLLAGAGIGVWAVRSYDDAIGHKRRDAIRKFIIPDAVPSPPPRVDCARCGSTILRDQAKKVLVASMMLDELPWVPCPFPGNPVYYCRDCAPKYDEDLGYAATMKGVPRYRRQMPCTEDGAPVGYVEAPAPKKPAKRPGAHSKTSAPRVTVRHGRAGEVPFKRPRT